jgi:hypothetical protein
MTKYNLSGIFGTLNDSDTPDIYPQNTTNKGNTSYVTVSSEILTDADIYTFSMFCETVGIEIDELLNFGTATYVDDVFKGHCPAFLGRCEDEKGEYIGLKIGSDAGEYKAPILRVFTEIKEETIGKKKRERLVYVVNDSCLLDLTEGEDNEGKRTGKYYCSVSNDEGDIFTFPIMLDKKLLEDQDPAIVIRSWRDGSILSLMKKFGTGGSNVWGTLNKMFIPRFIDNTFPKSGVFILVEAGVIKTTLAGSHPNVTSDIVQPEWKVIACSHPDMIVQHKDITKEFVDITLGEVTVIQGSAAANNNECNSWLVNNFHTYDGGVVLLHVVRAAQTIKNTPINTVTALPNKIERKISMYPELLATYKEKTGKINTTAQLAIAPAKVSDSDAVDSLNGYMNQIVDAEGVEDIPF